MKWVMFLSKAGSSGEGGDVRAGVAQVEAGRWGIPLPACSFHVSVALGSLVSPEEPQEGCWEDSRVHSMQKEDPIT